MILTLEFHRLADKMPPLHEEVLAFLDGKSEIVALWSDLSENGGYCWMWDNPAIRIVIRASDTDLWTDWPIKKP